jgi:hypothetical protein
MGHGGGRLERGRAVNRTAVNPVEVYLILSDVVCDLPINAVVRFDDLSPGVVRFARAASAFYYAAIYDGNNQPY